MNLHQDKSLFQDAVLATAQQLKIPEIYIEKDYWVTYALHQLFTGEIGNEVVFKGGTALSKCFGLIQRFSEDIDLIVFRNESDSANELKTKLKSISSAIAKDLPEIEIKDISFGKTSLEMKIISTDKNIKAHIHLIGSDKLFSRLEEKTGKTRSQIGIPE